MPSVLLDESNPTLADLIDRLAPGEEVAIVRAGKPVATLKAASPDLPVGVPILGRGKGKVLYMAPDFDEPMDEDFECLK